MAMATLSDQGSVLGSSELNHGLGGEQEPTNMNSGLWATLPEYLIEEILGKLPFSSLVGFCRLSKRWRDLIFSSKAFPRCTSPCGRLVSFSWQRNDMNLSISLSMTMNVCSALSMEEWQTVSLYLVKASEGGVTTKALRVQKARLMSAGGLLCFPTLKVGEYIVHNPVSKWRKTLRMPCQEEKPINDGPYMLYTIDGVLGLSSLLLEGMVVDWDTGHFKLIIGSFFGGINTTQVYDSRADSWNKVVEIPECILESLDNYVLYYSKNFVIQPIASGGNLFFYLKFIESLEDLLLRYDVEEQAWTRVPLPKHVYNSHVVTSRNITQCNGKLLLVTPTYVLQEDVRIHMSVQVFELRDSAASVLELQEPWSTLWLPTNSSPFSRIREEMSSSSVCKEFPPGTRVQCLGEGDVMFFIKTNIYSKKTSIRKWFHNVATNSYINTNWEDYQGDSLDFHIFKLSTAFLK